MSGPRLTSNERRAMNDLVEAVEALMLDYDAEAVGRIADYVGECGTPSDNADVDGVVVECLRVVVDAMVRLGR